MSPCLTESLYLNYSYSSPPHLKLHSYSVRLCIVRTHEGITSRRPTARARDSMTSSPKWRLNNNEKCSTDHIDVESTSDTLPVWSTGCVIVIQLPEISSAMFRLLFRLLCSRKQMTSHSSVSRAGWWRIDDLLQVKHLHSYLHDIKVLASKQACMHRGEEMLSRLPCSSA